MASVKGPGAAAQPEGELLPRLRWLPRAPSLLLSTYAQLLFSRSKLAGLCLLLASATSPSCLAHGVAAVLAAWALSRALGFSTEAAEQGPIAYNALLVGAGVGYAFAPGPPSVLFAIALSALSVITTASLTSLLPRLTALPVLSLPFVAVYAAALGVGPSLGLVPAGHTISAGAGSFGEMFLSSLGLLVFAPRPEAGALVLLGMVMHSRITTLLSLGAFALVEASLPASFDAATTVALGLNAWLTAMALGGVYFVPSSSSFKLAALGAVASTLVALGLASPLARVGVPSLIIPFNVAVLMTLLALRQRLADGSPKVVELDEGSPEANLHQHRTRLARFDAPYVVSFGLPFRGRWECTQGVDGEHTHQGPWRHGFDFEVRDATGELSQGGGHTAHDHHCFKLPVLAAADGTVVTVVNDVADNPVGKVDVERNWGNLVLVYHAPGLYSLVAHLAQGSVKVAPGQLVRRGDTLGACGSSGRSPRPHLHFQLQGFADIGAPTLPCRFRDVVLSTADGEVLSLSTTPALGETMRGLEPGPEAASVLAFEPGESFALDVDGKVEHITSRLDLLGRRQLVSVEHGATLTFERTFEAFTVIDVTGPARSALHLVRAALSRVPFDGNETLCHEDYLPPSFGGGVVRRLVADLLMPFIDGGGVAMAYRVSREGGQIVQTGTSRKTSLTGAPLLETRAVLGPDGRISSIEVRRGTTVQRAMRTAPRAPQPTGGAVASRLLTAIAQTLS